MNEDAARLLLNKVDVIFVWVRLFYRNVPAYPCYILFLYFVFQKLFLINVFARWPVHRTSRILSAHKIVVGKNSAPGMSPANYIQAKNGIVFGENVMLGPGVGVISAGHNEDDLARWDDCPPIVIGDNVWVGMNSVILPGVKIGDNVVVGAGSVVTKDLPSNTVAVGNPCKVVRVRKSK